MSAYFLQFLHSGSNFLIQNLKELNTRQSLQHFSIKTDSEINKKMTLHLIQSESPSVLLPSSQSSSGRWSFYTHTSWCLLPPRSWQESGRREFSISSKRRQPLVRHLMKCAGFTSGGFMFRTLVILPWRDGNITRSKLSVMFEILKKKKRMEGMWRKGRPAWWGNVGC